MKQQEKMNTIPHKIKTTLILIMPHEFHRSAMYPYFGGFRS